MSSSVLRFSDRVADYVKYRPSYPAELVLFMESHVGLLPQSTIVDVGSGTGISAELFLKKGYVVYAVEPNAPMREAAEQRLAHYPHFHSVDGHAEATTLPGHWADFVIAAQAFHWFDPIRTKEEFARILKPQGRVCLIWNDRKTSDSEFAIAYEALIEQFAIDYRQVRHSNIGEEQLRSFLGVYRLQAFANFQELDFDGLLGRITSCSYIPNVGHPRFAPMREAVQQLFNRFQKNGVVRVEYETQLFYSE